MKILVCRTDRLGDVMMALPTLQYLREALPSKEIDFCCPPAFRDLLQPFLSARGIRWVESPEWRAYSAALFLNYRPDFFSKSWRARVPIRFGNRSRLASLLFLNGGVKQRRSAAEKSEGLYTLDLGRAFLSRISKNAALPVLKPILLEGDGPSEEKALRAIDGLGEFAVVHPGMGGGSALNLSAARYAEVVDAIGERFRVKVVLSEGPSPEDKRLVAEVGALRPDIKVIRGVELAVLREVFRKAKLVAAPSTGPLHLAHYSGTRTIGLYSPVRAQRPERWAVWGGAGEPITLVPEVDCPGKRDCIGKGCPEYFCMEKLAWGRLILDGGGGLRG